MFDVSLGKKRVWRNFGVGIGYSSFKDDDDAGITARVPHPVVFRQPRTESTTVSGLEHTENVVHLQFMWTIPYRRKIRARAVRRPLILYRASGPGNRAGTDIADPPPLDSQCHVTRREGQPRRLQHRRRTAVTTSRALPWSRSASACSRATSVRSLDLPSAAGATLDGDLNGRRLSGRRRSPTRVLSLA